MKKQLFFSLLILAAFTRCGKAASTATNPTSGSNNSKWTFGGTNYSATNSTHNGTILGATDVNGLSTLTVSTGSNPFPTSNDSFMITTQGLYYPKSLYILVMVGKKEYTSLYKINQREATINIDSGKVSITIPQIWMYGIINTTAGDSQQFSGTISQ